MMGRSGPEFQDMIFLIGEFELDTQAYELRRNGDRVAVEPQVFDLLQLLVENRDRVVTKDEIHSKIWKNRVVSDAALSNRIKSARKAISDSGRKQAKIQTHHGRGFRFVGEVILIDSSTNSSISTINSINLPEKKSIAVLPFTNMSDDIEQEYFSDGITEDITTDLSHVSGLFVVARNSSFTYKNKAIKVQNVCADLGVNYLLEGSVRKVGDNVRITAQLIEGTTGGHLWAERFDRDLTDVFTIQSEISYSIVNALKLVLTPSEDKYFRHTPTDNFDAYDYCLRGREYFNRLTQKSLEIAQQMYSAAIALDPKYSLAFIGLADCSARWYQYYDSDTRHLNEGFAAISRALELEPRQAAVHASRGFLYSLQLDYDEANIEFEKAIALSNENFEAYFFFGRSCFIHGDPERAAVLFEQASRVSPNDFQSQMMLANVYRSLGRQSDARKVARKTIHLAEKSIALNPDDVRAYYAGAGAWTDLGDRNRTFEWVERALSIDSEDSTIFYNLACIYAKWGESDRAIDCLDRALDESNIIKRREWIERDTDLDSIRDHPRFKLLLRISDE